MRELYNSITSQIVGLLNRGVVPWRSGILGDACQPQNYDTRRPYRGLNVFLLSAAAAVHGYRSPLWLTFRQARAQGGTIRKGEKASWVIFWKPVEVEGEQDSQKKAIPVLRQYPVFNLDQTEGMPREELPPEAKLAFHPIAEAERVVRDYREGPVIRHGGSQAYYSASTDEVAIPHPRYFKPVEEYYSTLFHELVHSTGHPKRLNRTLETASERVRTPEYGKEELIAEMGAAFLCGHCRIARPVIDNQAAYIDGWLRLIRQDQRVLFSAASAAQKAADWILQPDTSTALTNGACQEQIENFN